MDELSWISPAVQPTEFCHKGK